MSPDGSTVVGTSGTAFAWTQSTGLVDLGDLPGREVSAIAHDASNNGVVVGGSRSFLNGTTEAFVWTEAGGMLGLGALGPRPPATYESQATAVSADGRVVVGLSSAPADRTAFYWTEAEGMVDLGATFGLLAPTGALGVSADGTTIVGGVGAGPFLWTRSGGYVALGTLPGGVSSGSARAVSGDGKIVVGSVGGAILREEAFRWTEATGMQSLGSLPNVGATIATTVSDDGRVIAGQLGFADGSPAAAFVWTETGGIQRLDTVLGTILGVDVTGWTLSNVYGMSADGLTLAGTGRNPSGQSEAWVATLPASFVIPEPSTAVLVALGVVGLGARRRVVVARGTGERRTLLA